MTINRIMWTSFVVFCSIPLESYASGETHPQRLNGGSTAKQPDRSKQNKVAAPKDGQSKSGKQPRQKVGENSDATFKTMRDKSSYELGLTFGQKLERNGIKLNTRLVIQGLIDGLKKAKPKLSAKERRDARSNYNHGKGIRKVGEDYLAKNKTRKGVKTTKSGLQYKILRAGTGKFPTKTDTVKIRYVGKLIDGTPFSTTHSKQPATTPVSGKTVIQGWTEALRLMKVGAKWKLYIPSDLAWSEHPLPSNLGPHAVLIYEMELLEIVSVRTQNQPRICR